MNHNDLVAATRNDMPAQETGCERHWREQAEREANHIAGLEAELSRIAAGITQEQENG